MMNTTTTEYPTRLPTTEELALALAESDRLAAELADLGVDLSSYSDEDCVGAW